MKIAEDTKLTQVEIEDRGITWRGDGETERTVIVRAMIGDREREIEAAVLIDGDGQPVEDPPAGGTLDGVDFAPLAASVYAREHGLSDSAEALLECELVEAALIEVADAEEFAESEADAEGWRPTHKIVHDGRTVAVYLLDGAAYTLEEWINTTHAGYERSDEGDWLFHGEPFAGTVTSID